MSQEAQREVLNNRGTLHQVEVVDTDLDQVSQVSGVTGPTAPTIPAATASINQVSAASQPFPFGGRAAYRQP